MPEMAANREQKANGKTITSWVVVFFL